MLIPKILGDDPAAAGFFLEGIFYEYADAFAITFLSVCIVSQVKGQIVGCNMVLDKIQLGIVFLGGIPDYAVLMELMQFANDLLEIPSHQVGD